MLDTFRDLTKPISHRFPLKNIKVNVKFAELGPETYLTRKSRTTIIFRVFLSFCDPLGVELWPMSIFIGGKRAATSPEIQNYIKLKDSGLETYLTRKSAKNYAEWSNSELLERSGCRVMPKSLYL